LAVVEERPKHLREKGFEETENAARKKPNILLNKLLAFWVSVMQKH
jgi:hypothetical protein